MSFILRRFRGLGVALAVLAISAGAVFAAAPSLSLSSHASDQAKTHTTANADPTESAEASKSPEPSDSAEPSESPEPSDSAQPSQSPAALGSPAASESPSPDTHGALVSTAAQMPTPSGFPNHGAFVSCVAHLSASLTGFDWTTVTPQSCGITTSTTVQGNSSHVGPNGNSQGHGQGDKHRNSHATSH